jgi:hypothetical protein
MAEHRQCIACEKDFRPRRARQKYCGKDCAAYQPHRARTEQTCCRCQVTKPVALFRPLADGRIRYRKTCIVCEDARSANAATTSRRSAIARRAAAYDLSLDDYDLILQTQGHVCLICGVAHEPEEVMRQLVIDHAHDSGDIRGLLCRNCNSGLGFFADDPSRLAAAITYLASAHERMETPINAGRRARQAQRTLLKHQGRALPSRQCVQCHTTFTVHSLRATQRFCSHACDAASRTKPPTPKRDPAETKRLRKLNHRGGRRRIYRIPVPKPCKLCGVMFLPRQATKQKPETVYCSRDCGSQGGSVVSQLLAFATERMAYESL